ncbi:MAG: spondin domain-containing protein [Pleurocapsa sp.]
MPETNVTVTIENLAPENGTFITPVWVGFHNGGFDTYDRGRPVSPGLESLAEDGDTSGISQEFLDSGNGTVDATLLGLEGVEGPIDPGEVVSQTFTLDSEDPNNRFFNYASMVLPSNDAFIANGNETAIPIFDENGHFIGTDFIIYGNQVLDAGTEINDEAKDSTAFFGQSAPNTGET